MEALQIRFKTNPSLDKVMGYNVVAAIDFGTTYSGYAFSTRSDPDEIHMNKEWGAVFSTRSFKTPTAVLTDKNKRFVDFGYDAKHKYLIDEGTNFYQIYDQCFKMKLYEAKNLLTSINVASRNGKQTLPLLSLISMSIKYLYNHMLNVLQKAGVGIRESDVRVILTIPAIWDDMAKDFMRRAANEAGINSGQLILALEPEVASLHCRTLKPTELMQNEDGVEVKMPDGTRFIAIDCGGGTVDISVHEAADGIKVKEIYFANGGPWGGNKVNEGFEEMLQKLLGTDFIRNFKEKESLIWSEFEQDFEEIKRTFKGGNRVFINLPYNLINAYQNDGNDIEKRIKTFDGYRFRSGKLELLPSVFETLFETSMTNIISHIKTLWENKEIAKAKYVFMIGGFSESAYLFKQVKNAFTKFNSKVHVLEPYMAGIAVLKGAVRFGHVPHAIKSRICRKTYGAGVMQSFDPIEHDPSKKTTVDGESKCTDIFSLWAKKNESIEVGEKRIFTIYPHSKTSTTFHVSIYASEKEDVKYITDEGVNKLATLQIPIPDSHKPKNQRAVKHYVYFGGTELHVTIQDMASFGGASTEITIPFSFE